MNSRVAAVSSAGDLASFIAYNWHSEFICMGLVETRSGEVRFEGVRIDRRAPHEIARLGLGYVPEDRRIFTDLTVAENLEVGRQPPRSGAPTWTTQKLLALFPTLGPMDPAILS